MHCQNIRMRSQLGWRWYTGALVATDAGLLALAFVLAAHLQSSFDLLSRPVEFNEVRYGLVVIALLPGLVVVIWLRHGYARRHLLGGPEEYARVVSGCTYGTLLAVGASFLDGSLPLLSRGWLLMFWMLSVLLVGSGRFILRRVAYSLRRHGWFVQRALIAGASEQGLMIAQQLHRSGWQGVEVAGFLDDYLATGSVVTAWTTDQRRQAPGFLTVVGHPRDARTLAAKHNCGLLIVVPAALNWESQHLLARLTGTAEDWLDVRVAPSLYDLMTSSLEPAPLGHVPLVRPHQTRIMGIEALTRAALDACIAALWLILVSPAFVWVVFGSWLRGVRPLLVRRRVLGQGNRPVSLMLLRSDVSERLLLRGVPALVAVLRGDLALVGPRPVPVDKQTAYACWIELLITVKPGLTGPWRLADPGLSAEETVMADVWWVRNWSLWQHLFVLYQTACRLVSRRGAHEGLVRWEAHGAESRGADSLAQPYGAV
jgi:lipopolysaccharide/colanic/teichoic acid biosynthesis glycosyltransferase